MDVKVPYATAGADQEVARQHYVRLPTPPQSLLARATEEAREEVKDGGAQTALPASGGLHLFLPDEITLHVLPSPPNAPSTALPYVLLTPPRSLSAHTGIRLFGRTVAVPCEPDLLALVRSSSPKCDRHLTCVATSPVAPRAGCAAYWACTWWWVGGWGTGTRWRTTATGWVRL
jgi:hypothetical protein